MLSTIPIQQLTQYVIIIQIIRYNSAIYLQGRNELSPTTDKILILSFHIQTTLATI